MSQSRAFSTNNSEYILVYTAHYETYFFEENKKPKITKEEITKTDNLKNLDAIILESGEYPMSAEILADTQYSQIIKNIRQLPENKRPLLYLVDVNIRNEFGTDRAEQIQKATATISVGSAATYFVSRSLYKQPKTSRRDFLKKVMIGSLGLTAAGTTASYIAGTPKRAVGRLIKQGRADESSARFISWYNHQFQISLVTARNAISAWKLDEIVAPFLRESLNRTPRIAMIYGAAHAGIKECLQDKNRRDNIIKTFYQQGLPGLEDDINQMCIIKLTGQEGSTYHPHKSQDYEGPMRKMIKSAFLQKTTKNIK